MTVLYKMTFCCIILTQISKCSNTHILLCVMIANIFHDHMAIFFILNTFFNKPACCGGGGGVTSMLGGRAL